jgi:hypothetical protein
LEAFFLFLGYLHYPHYLGRLSRLQGLPHYRRQEPQVYPRIEFFYFYRILRNNVAIMSAAPSNYDPEKNLNLEDSDGNDSPSRNDWAPGQDEPKRPWTTRFVDSFKRDPNAHVLKSTQETTNPREFDHLAAAERTANSGLATKLKGRHLQMIAIGGSIGSSRNLT